MIEFTTEDVIFQPNKYGEWVQVLPQQLRKGEIFRIYGSDNEYKMTGSYVERGRLVIEAEKIPECFFKIWHKRYQQIYGVEAICDKKEYMIRHRGRIEWVPLNDCMVV